MSETKNPVEVVNIRRFLMLKTKGEAFTAAYEAEKGRQAAIAEAEAERDSRARTMAELSQVEPAKVKTRTVKLPKERIPELVEYRKTHTVQQCADAFGIKYSHVTKAISEARKLGLFATNSKPVLEDCMGRVIRCK